MTNRHTDRQWDVIHKRADRVTGREIEKVNQMIVSVSSDILFRWLFTASNPNIHLKTLTGIENGSVRLTVCIRLGIRNHPSHFCGNPLPVVQRDRGRVW
jgi:hypothetical protein